MLHKSGKRYNFDKTLEVLVQCLLHVCQFLFFKIAVGSFEKAIHDLALI